MNAGRLEELRFRGLEGSRIRCLEGFEGIEPRLES